MLFQASSLTRYAALPLLVLATSAQAQSIALSDKNNQISISPQDLEISWNDLIVNSQAMKVNQHTQVASDLVSVSKTEAHWTLQPSGIRVSTKLVKGALTISLSLIHI